MLENFRANVLKALVNRVCLFLSLLIVYLVS